MGASAAISSVWSWEAFGRAIGAVNAPGLQEFQKIGGAPKCMLDLLLIPTGVSISSADIATLANQSRYTPRRRMDCFVASAFRLRPSKAPETDKDAAKLSLKELKRLDRGPVRLSVQASLIAATATLLRFRA
jgi:hypothetical protein